MNIEIRGEPGHYTATRICADGSEVVLDADPNYTQNYPRLSCWVHTHHPTATVRPSPAILAQRQALARRSLGLSAYSYAPEGSAAYDVDTPEGAAAAHRADLLAWPYVPASEY